MNLGNSLIPVTGVVLLLRTVLEGNYWQALPFVPPVVGVTLAGCLLAIRWAVDQFNSETVLFRESERLDLGLWFKHLLRDRDDTPSVSEAVFCGVLILMIWFFMSFALAVADDVCRIRRIGVGDAVGGDRHASLADDGDAHAQPAQDVVAESSPLAGDPGGAAAGLVAAPCGGGPADAGHTAVPGR